MLEKREIPQTDALSFPSTDQMRHDVLINALDLMNHQLDGFNAALELFDYALAKTKTAKRRRMDMFRQWLFIAARDGAITVYNFQIALGAVIETVNTSQFLFDKVDKAALKAARKHFESAFPVARDMRHSVGHATDKARNVKQHLENGYSGVLNVPGLELDLVKDYLVVDHLEGRTLYNSFEKKIVCYTIDQAALDHLAAVRNEVFDQFDTVIEANRTVPARPKLAL